MGAARERATFAQRGGWWVAAQAPMMLVAAVLPVWTGDGAVLPVRWAGFAIAAAAVVFGVWAGFALGRSLTPYPRPLAEGELAAHGPYRYVRHPIYSAVLAAAAGWAFAWQSAWGCAFLPLLVAFFDLKARREELWLVEKYPGYAGYRKKVRKFLPGIY